MRWAVNSSTLKRVTAAEWTINDHSNTALLRKRQNPFLRFAFHQRIVDLHEIELLAAHDLFHFTESAGFVMRNPHVANPSLLLPFTQCREVRMDIYQVVHLHQVDPFRTQKRHRTFHRFDPALFAARPHFGGDKKFVANSERRREIPDHLLSTAIHGRRINHAPTKLNKKR